MFNFFPLDVLTLPFIFTYAFIKYIVGRIAPWSALQPNDHYVLVTGAGSGFGASLCEQLDKQGWRVLAGVRSERSLEKLQSKLSKRAHVFQLDITKEDDVSHAIEVVKQKVGDKGLHALVNNAGRSGGCAVSEMIPMPEFRSVMDVNFFGHVVLTKALLPFIYQAKVRGPRYGRVINLSSVAGILAGPTMGVYSSSKFAMEAWSDVLRRELQAWHIPVSIVEPGFFATKMVSGNRAEAERLLMETTEEQVQRWGEGYLQTDKFDVGGLVAEHPSIATAELVKAVTSTRPSRYYRPGLQSSLFFYPMSLAPASCVDAFSPMLMGTPRPKPLYPGQRSAISYYLSEKVTGGLLDLLKRRGVLPGADEPPLTWDKLQQKQKQHKQEQAKAQPNGSKHK